MKKNKSLFLVVSFVLFLVGVVSFLVPFWNMTAKTILSSESSSTAFNFLDDIDGVKSLYQASNLEFKAEGAVLTTKICVLVAFAALALFFVFQYGQASKLNRLISIVLAYLLQLLLLFASLLQVLKEKHLTHLFLTHSTLTLVLILLLLALAYQQSLVHLLALQNKICYM